MASSHSMQSVRFRPMSMSGWQLVSQASRADLVRRVSLAEIPMYWVAARDGGGDSASCRMARSIGAVV